MDPGDSIDIKKIEVVKIEIKAVIGVENRQHGCPCPHCVWNIRAHAHIVYLTTMSWLDTKHRQE